MNTTDMSQLELKIATMLQSMERLQSENHSLRKKLAKMVQTRSTLEDKNKVAAARIRQIINHLREEIS